MIKVKKSAVILFIIFVSLLSGHFLECAEASDTRQAPYIRVWRGFRRPDLTQETLRDGVEKNLIPATKALFDRHRGVGRAYLPVIPPFGLQGTVPDEMAIIIYKSEEEYRKMRATPEGVAYGDLHWTLFERPGNRTKSGGAVPFAGEVVLDTPYNVVSRRLSRLKTNKYGEVVLDKPYRRLNWQRGHSTFFLGALKPGISPQQMADHVTQVRDAFRSRGLLGYIAVFDSNGFEAAWQNWASKAHAERAWSSPAGQAIAKAAGEMFNPLQWVTADIFRGSIKAGQLVKVLFRAR